jgi:hypothetical protein
MYYRNSEPSRLRSGPEPSSCCHSDSEHQLLSLCCSNAGQTSKPTGSGQSQKNQKTQPPTATPQSPQPPARIKLGDKPDATLSDVNVEITVDRRVIVMMAALNVAGYDYESGNRSLSALRRQVREDLKQTNPVLVEKLEGLLSGASWRKVGCGGGSALSDIGTFDHRRSSFHY